VRMSLTLALAIASFVFVEQPIRQGRAVIGRTRWIALPSAAAVAAGVALVVGLAAPPLPAKFAPEVSQASVLRAAREQLATSTTTLPTARSTQPTPTQPAPVPVKRILVVGDSVALTLARGLERWAAANGVTVLNAGVIGCSLLNGVDVRGYWGVATRIDDPCQSRRTWPEFKRDFEPDTIIALYGAWDVYDASFDHGDTWVSPGEPAFDRYYTEMVADASSRLRETAPRVLWLTPPCFAAKPFAEDADADWYDAARVDSLTRVMHEVGKKNGVIVSDVVHDAGCPVDRDKRPDGVHYTDEGADLATELLAPALTRLGG
jgi:hypothetical protein